MYKLSCQQAVMLTWRYSGLRELSVQELEVEGSSTRPKIVQDEKNAKQDVRHTKQDAC